MSKDPFVKDNSGGDAMIEKESDPHAAFEAFSDVAPLAGWVILRPIIFLPPQLLHGRIHGGGFQLKSELDCFPSKTESKANNKGGEGSDRILTLLCHD